ncbi:hypothetical protein [Saccharomonospora viridis]|uniref:Uncharacterized protein n=2 Tax=Saccharomonospora viridis TaxID=1852 RepID=C7MXE5_SACVD|nr:hypothetical protein [Saccharomonospora viridis]ACU95954.1 hypothetical protein Svir_08940 [Saccharomonospora viridis DSM 43017]KHF45550.1 hypothetical protein MINT15_07670 [Saccharomonospora viridis]SFP74273.1 hypothetical protein SAMN02982918_3234 [Saccharomonospora viridis]
MKRAITALFVLFLIVCAGCGMGGVSVEHDEELQDRLRELSAAGASASLAELTEGGWDTVYVFSEGASAERIEREVGQAVLSSEYYYDAGNLLVFARDGEVVRAVTVLPDLLATGGQSRWSHDVRLEPQGKRTPAVLRLVEPAP